MEQTRRKRISFLDVRSEEERMNQYKEAITGNNTTMALERTIEAKERTDWAATRTELANRRTLLAYVRTSLGIAALAQRSQLTGFAVTGIVFILLALFDYTTVYSSIYPKVFQFRNFSLTGIIVFLTPVIVSIIALFVLGQLSLN